MQRITDEVTVDAPIERVWDAIRDPGEHAHWHPFATAIEGEHALGSTRKCSVLVGKKPSTTEERCTSYEEQRRITWTVEHDSAGFSRMVSDWSAGFSLESRGPRETRVTAESLFSPRLPARLMMPVIRRKFHQTQRAILDALKQHTEQNERTEAAL
jgi:uncharacterized protein YndB with AHSA1/START domain